MTRLDIDSPMAVTESEIKVQDSGRKSEQTVIESQINARTVTEKGQNLADLARRNKEPSLTLADLPSSAKKIQKEKGKEERKKEKSSPEVAITSDFFFSLSSKPLPLPLPPTPGLP
jgi:hypothetical protein